MFYPEKIRKGDIIGVTATSAGLEDEAALNKLENAIKKFKEIGYNIVETSNVRGNCKLVSSSKEERANEFMDVWNNKEIKYIILARGGEFLVDMLPYLDIKRIKDSKPKWVQGFSDSSLLLFYLTTNFGYSTIHGNNFSAYGMNVWHDSLKNTIDFASDNKNVFLQESFEKYEVNPLNREEGKELGCYNLTEQVMYKNLYGHENEKFSGRLIGGCIDVLKNIIGTNFDNTIDFCDSCDDGVVWYLENCEMSVPELYRALWHMKSYGWFDNNINGVLIGRTRSNQTINNFSYEDVLHEIFDDINVPVIYDVDFGHVAPQWTMINGAFAEFEYSNGKGKLLTKLV